MGVVKGVCTKVVVANAAVINLLCHVINFISRWIKSSSRIRVSSMFYFGGKGI